MSILLAAAALALQATAAPPPPTDEEILVIGQRMRRLKLVTKTDRKTGLTRCVFKRRSRDAAFDKVMCEAALACGKTATTRAQMEACIGPRVDAYARALTARRKAAAADRDR